MGKKVAPEEKVDKRRKGKRSSRPQNEKGDGLDELGNIRGSLKDLVVYNDQGQPTIDINRLAYKPKTKLLEPEKEKLSWYLPDYVFVIFNFLSLTYSTYYLINGLTIISWRNSMQLFFIQNCDEPMNENVEICRTIKEQYGDEDMSPYTMIRFYGAVDSSTHGAIMFLIGLINLVNILVGINACIDGSKSLLFSYLVVDAILMVSEVLLVTVLHLTGICDQRDIEIVSAFLIRHLDNYAKDIPDPEIMVKKDTMELDLIQLSLTCCGVGNWTDYLPRSTWDESAGEFVTRAVVERFNLDKSDMIIPASCCRQWWVRNLYCSHEAHLWAYPTTIPLEAHQFRQRISQWGCLPKMVDLCKNIVDMAGIGGMVAWAIHCFLSVVRFACGISQIERNNNMIWQKKKEGNESANEDEKNKFPSLSSLFGFSSDSDGGEEEDDDLVDLPRYPNEKEIERMKSTRKFDRVQSAMKDTHMEHWLQKSRAFVEGSKDRNNGYGTDIPKRANMHQEEFNIRGVQI